MQHLFAYLEMQKAWERGWDCWIIITRLKVEERGDTFLGLIYTPAFVCLQYAKMKKPGDAEGLETRINCHYPVCMRTARVE